MAPYRPVLRHHRPEVLARNAARCASLAFAALVVGFSGCLAWAMTRPMDDGPASPLLLPVHESRAATALTGLSGRKATPSDSDRLGEAERESLAGLALAPATATGWLRLAYVQHQRAGAIDRVVLENLEHSYEAAPLGPDVTGWRLRFMFENWSLLNQDLRRLAVKELTTTARYRGVRARTFTEEIQNPRGRLAAQMATRIARSYDPDPARRTVAQTPPVKLLSGNKNEKP